MIGPAFASGGSRGSQTRLRAAPWRVDLTYALLALGPWLTLLVTALTATAEPLTFWSFGGAATGFATVVLGSVLALGRSNPAPLPRLGAFTLGLAGSALTSSSILSALMLSSALAWGGIPGLLLLGGLLVSFRASLRRSVLWTSIALLGIAAAILVGSGFQESTRREISTTYLILQGSSTVVHRLGILAVYIAAVVSAYRWFFRRRAVYRSAVDLADVFE